MGKLSLLLLTVSILFLSCATSMTPMELNKTLPKLTKAQFISPIQVEESIKNNNCKYLVKDREYVAEIGLTIKEDLKYGAKGIDEWVALDIGNAYTLKNYEWVTIDIYGSTQLRLKFDTMLCE